MTNTAYVYKWTHIPTLKWYVGSRTAKNSHPDDGYICSSLIVKPMIQKNPEEWKREILFIGEPELAFEFETEILQLFDARRDPRSFNGHNNDGVRYNIITDEIRKSLSDRMKGTTWNRGRKQSDELKLKKSLKLKGVKKPPMSKTHYNNIVNRIRENYKNNPEIRKKQSVSHQNLPLLECPHCGFKAKPAPAKRWHFDNCKYKKDISLNNNKTSIEAPTDIPRKQIT